MTASADGRRSDLSARHCRNCGQPTHNRTRDHRLPHPGVRCTCPVVTECMPCFGERDPWGAIGPLTRREMTHPGTIRYVGHEQEAHRKIDALLAHAHGTDNEHEARAFKHKAGRILLRLLTSGE